MQPSLALIFISHHILGIIQFTPLKAMGSTKATSMFITISNVMAGDAITEGLDASPAVLRPCAYAFLSCLSWLSSHVRVHQKSRMWRQFGTSSAIFMLHNCRDQAMAFGPLVISRYRDFSTMTKRFRTSSIASSRAGLPPAVDQHLLHGALKPFG
jgi:hypothetical protein